MRLKEDEHRNKLIADVESARMQMHRDNEVEMTRKVNDHEQLLKQQDKVAENLKMEL